MKKDIRITPIGLKGNEINERMKTLMGIQPINENKKNIVIELTKMGPDGNAYAIVRENHEWYIKKATKKDGLIAEDFKYIGGLMNKKSESYPSYSKAIKQLNLKFNSLAEAYNFEGEINIFENDNLISEDIAGYSEMKTSGFSGEGNLEGNTSMTETEEEVVTEEEDEDEDEDEDEMSESEKAVDAMLTTEVRGPWSYNKNDDEDEDDSEVKEGEDEEEEEEEEKEEEVVTEGKLSIENAISKMDFLIDNLTRGLKKKV